MASLSEPDFEQAVQRMDDGVLAAYLPAEMVYTEHMLEAGVGLTIPAVGLGVTEILIDIVPQGAQDPPMKHYRVRQWARQLGMGYVDPVWSGDARDFRFEALPPNHKPDTVLHLRRYSRGPWFRFTRKDQDEAEKETTLSE